MRKTNNGNIKCLLGLNYIDANLKLARSLFAGLSQYFPSFFFIFFPFLFFRFPMLHTTCIHHNNRPRITDTNSAMYCRLQRIAVESREVYDAGVKEAPRPSTHHGGNRRADTRRKPAPFR